VTILSADWVLPVSAPPIRDGAVAIEDGRIAAVGPAVELGEGTRYPDAAIVPGLVNAHTHLEYAVYSGFGDGLGDFARWVNLHTERKRWIGWPESLDIARLGAAECLASGVTTIGDCSFSGAAGVAAGELGLRGIVYLEVFGSDPAAALERFAALRERAEPALSDRLRLGVSPHAPYSVSVDVYRACAELGLPLATHLSESESEVRYLHDGGGAWHGIDWLVEPAGTTGTRALAGAGLLGPRLLVAHGVVLDDEEIALLAHHGVAVVHCPRSNAFLGSGIAPLQELREAGVRVGIGTDSPASAPSFDIFDELRVAVALARVRARSPEGLSPTEALELATLGGARALGLADEIGSLEPGKRADLAVVSLAGSTYLPWEDPAVAVVLGGSPARVVTTLVDGAVRYDRETFEWRELQQRGIEARSRLLGVSPAHLAAPARPPGR
jgi:cytosine/adenosine deaminase-related metal-dependent hydrolase